ncbi:MAG: MarC family protein [Alphaproteobacteria bacterium]|nr:MAG: MarC family protein [Alphaproteobacteria bacterium]
MLADLVTAFVSLFVVIDPIGLTPLFLALTPGASPAARRAIALRAGLIAAVILTLFGLAGEALLGAVGISMAAFRVAGGLLLFLTAIDMLFERRTERRERQGESAEFPDPSVFPLATPLIAGPGAIATMILLTGRSGGDWLWTLTVLGVMACVIALCVVLFMGSGILERILRRTGVLVVTRLLGMLLAALSVQFVADGLADFGLLPGAVAGAGG